MVSTLPQGDAGSGDALRALWAKGFVVLGISDEKAKEVKPFILEHKVSFPCCSTREEK